MNSQRESQGPRASAPLPPPVEMPAALQRLARTVAEAPGVGPSPPVTQPPAHPVPTAQLLHQIDDLHAAYQRVVEVTLLSLDPAAAHGRDSARLAEHLSQATAAYTDLAATVQAGIRSKVHQSARIAIIDHLRVEVAERRAAVERMEATIAAVRRSTQQSARA